MNFKREKINVGKDGLISGQDAKKLNDNFENMMYAISGNLDFSNFQEKVNNKINKQYFTFANRGNFDKDNPFVLRFFIPIGAKIKDCKFYSVLSNYKVDSDIGATNSRSIGVSVIVRSGGSSDNPIHNHEASGSVTIPQLQPTLEYKIKTCPTSPEGTKITLNNYKVANFDGIGSVNDIDISSSVKEGWNIIECTTPNLGFIDIYGYAGCIIE